MLYEKDNWFKKLEKIDEDGWNEGRIILLEKNIFWIERDLERIHHSYERKDHYSLEWFTKKSLIDLFPVYFAVVDECRKSPSTEFNEFLNLRKKSKEMSIIVNNVCYLLHNSPQERSISEYYRLADETLTTTKEMVNRKLKELQVPSKFKEEIILNKLKYEEGIEPPTFKNLMEECYSSKYEGNWEKFLEDKILLLKSQLRREKNPELKFQYRNELNRLLLLYESIK